MNDFRRPLVADESPLDPLAELFGDPLATRVPGIARSPMHVEVTNRVRNLIVEGHLRPGERINENDLAEFLQVSRTPLREALKELQSEGLVLHEPNKGSRVSYITPGHTAELFESLACLEGFCGEIATHKINELQLRRLAELHDEMYAFRRQGARSEYFELNERIHRAFIALAANALLMTIHAKLMVGAKRIRFSAIRYVDRWDDSVAEHQEILAAMRARDGQAVRGKIEAHVRATGTCVCQHLKELEAAPARPRRPLTYERRLRF